MRISASSISSRLTRSRSSAELLLGFGAFGAQPVEPATGLAGRVRLLLPALPQPLGELFDVGRLRDRAVRRSRSTAWRRRSSSVRRALGQRLPRRGGPRAGLRRRSAAGRARCGAPRPRRRAPRSPGAGGRPTRAAGPARRVARVPRRRRARSLRAAARSAIERVGMRRSFRFEGVDPRSERRLPFLERRAAHLDVAPELRARAP